MRQFVEANSRHGDLAAALGFRLGAGRGKVLVQLREGPMTLTQIAAMNRMDAPYATLIVDKLEARGLVERQLHSDDRRRKLVILTKAGREAIAAADAILLSAPSPLRDLRESDVHQLIGLLERLVETDGASSARGDESWRASSER
jgi:DNA-binding MarR family transcriptional regulator